MSELWQWVGDAQDKLRASGQHRLAWLIGNAPAACFDGEIETFEAMIDEGVALAQGLQNSWLEVYFRHWRLQRLVLKDRDVREKVVMEAVALYEFANRPESRDCPQSICTAQDICEALLAQDGPGNADRCLVASEETLARITPKRECYSCVGSAKVDSLIHLGRKAEAKEVARNMARQAGEANLFGGLTSAVGRTLLLNREWAEAYRVFSLPSHPGSGIPEAYKAAQQARCLAELGRPADAAKALPDPSDMRAADTLPYLGALLALIKQGFRGSWEEQERDERFATGQVKTLLERGALWEAAEAARLGAEMSARRDCLGGAVHFLGLWEAILPRLKKPELFSEQLRRTRAYVQMPMAERPPFANPGGEESEHPFAALEMMERTREALLGDMEMTLALCHMRIHGGRLPGARRLLAEHAKSKDARWKELRLAWLYRSNRMEEGKKLTLTEPVPESAIWTEIRMLELLKHKRWSMVLSEVAQAEPSEQLSWCKARALLGMGRAREASELARGLTSDTAEPILLDFCDHAAASGDQAALHYWLQRATEAQALPPLGARSSWEVTSDTPEDDEEPSRVEAEVVAPLQLEVVDFDNLAGAEMFGWKGRLEPENGSYHSLRFPDVAGPVRFAFDIVGYRPAKEVLARLGAALKAVGGVFREIDVYAGEEPPPDAPPEALKKEGTPFVWVVSLPLKADLSTLHWGLSQQREAAGYRLIWPRLGYGAGGDAGFEREVNRSRAWPD